MRSLQIIIHLPVFVIIVPGNIIITFKVIMAIVMFDVLENDYGYGPELLLTFDEEAHQRLNGVIRD